MYQRTRLGLGYLPQEPSVFRKLSVEENLKAVLELRRLSRQEQEQELEELLDEFDLQKVRRQKGNQLSGGERRRTEIARALALKPSFCFWTNPLRVLIPLQWPRFRLW